MRTILNSPVARACGWVVLLWCGVALWRDGFYLTALVGSVILALCAGANLADWHAGRGRR